MRKRSSVLLALVTIAALLLTTTAGLATPQSQPNGPWVESEQNVSLSRLMTNAELYDKLTQIQAVSKGRMSLEIAGYSNAINGNLMQAEGYPLYVAKFGNADPNKKRVLITSQIHGNETLGTEAAIDLMQKFAQGGREVDEILSKVTVWFMPRINPDGAMYQRDGQWYPIRQSLQAWNPAAIGLPSGTKSPWYYSSSIQGYDQNRDYNPNLDFRIENFDPNNVAAVLNNRNINNSNYGGFFVTPEARTVTKVFKELDPDVYFDLHHRGFNTVSDEDNRSVIIQVAAVVATDKYTDPFSGNTYAVDPNVIKLGKQVNAVGYLALQRGFSDFGAIQKYPDVNLPGTALGTFALNNTAIMLIEVKGQTQNLGQKESGKLIQSVKVPVYEILSSLADGSIYSVDTAIYDQIPESANSIKDPTP